MKLRNKKTGETEGVCFAMSGGRIAVIVDDMPLCGNSVLGEYESLAELNEEWEDAPTEPLIEDKEIREIVRPWAKVNGATELKYYEGENCLEDIFRNEIHFNQALGLEDAKTYTTEELCGTPDPIEMTFIDLDERVKEKEEEMTEPNLIDITNDKELMDRVLKKSAEMQEETLKKAEEKE